MTLKRQAILNLWVPVLIGVTLLVYVVVRAAILPITHDEANTCLTFSVTSFWDIVTYKDPIPNNHILNTLLIKFFTTIFGMHAFVARLPNLLGFLLYYSVLLVWLRKLSSNFIFILTGIILFTCNPYLMDFFSLARGYTLSISFMVTSSFFAWQYLQTRKSEHHLYAIIFAAIAVYTNFTTLNFFVVLVLLLTVADFQIHFHSDRKLFYERCKNTAIVTTLLGLISAYPIYRMVTTGQFVFWGTRGFYSDTLVTLVNSSSYGNHYLNLSTNSIVNIYLYLLFVIVMFAVAVLRQQHFKISQSSYSFFVLLLIGTAATNILQFYIVHTPYLTTRTALFYYPLSMISILFFLHFLQGGFRTGFLVLSLICIVAGITHMVRSVNFTSTYEWWFDKNNYQVLEKLDEEKSSNHGDITLDADWLFYPSLNFHIQTGDHKNIRLRDFHTDIDSNSVSEYYYIEGKDFSLLKNKYDIIERYDGGQRMLLRKKPAD